LVEQLVDLGHHRRDVSSLLHEADHIGPAGVERAGDGHLAHGQKVVGGRVLPVHHPHALRALAAVNVVVHHHGDSVAEQLPDLPVGGHET
jgi:hypothetical protein